MNHCAIYLKPTHHCKLTIFNFFFLIKRSHPLSQVYFFLGILGSRVIKGQQRVAKEKTIHVNVFESYS